MGGEVLGIGDRLAIPSDEIEEAASRSGGPGGQHVNKSNTRVTLRWSIRDSAVLTPETRKRLLERLGSRLNAAGELLVHSDSTRSRTRNRELARRRIVELVSEALIVPRKRHPTRATRASRERVLAAKTRRSQRKKERTRVRHFDD